MLIDNEVKLDYKDVLIRPKRSELSSRKEVSLERKYSFRNYVPNDMDMEDLRPQDGNYRGVPIMAANMDGVGTMEVADALAKDGIFTCLIKTYSLDELKDFFHAFNKRKEHVAYSLGISDLELAKLAEFMSVCRDDVKYLCIDVANGYGQKFVEFIKTIRATYPNHVIIAGNVVTADQTQELILAGADVVKVGIGPGSVCTTRIKTGVGYPQLSAVIECADAAHGLGGHIIADGGCTCPGDVAKAFSAGADFVMLGGMLAGHDEGGGEVIAKAYQSNELSFDQGGYQTKIEYKHFVKFYGMSSKEANDKHFGGLKAYRSSEGREVLVPYRGAISDTVQDVLGGLRSTCTYVGARTLKDLSKCTTFVRCTQQFNGVFV